MILVRGKGGGGGVLIVSGFAALKEGVVIVFVVGFVLALRSNLHFAVHAKCTNATRIVSHCEVAFSQLLCCHPCKYILHVKEFKCIIVWVMIGIIIMIRLTH